MPRMSDAESVKGHVIFSPPRISNQRRSSLCDLPRGFPIQMNGKRNANRFWHRICSQSLKIHCANPPLGWPYKGKVTQEVQWPPNIQWPQAVMDSYLDSHTTRASPGEANQHSCSDCPHSAAMPHPLSKNLGGGGGVKSLVLGCH